MVATNVSEERCERGRGIWANGYKARERRDRGGVHRFMGTKLPMSTTQTTVDSNLLYISN